MYSAFVFCTGLVVLPVSNPSIGGMNLYWDNCSLAGSTYRTFACNSNAGSNVMVASFAPPAGITKLIASRAVIDLQTGSDPLPSWWHLEPGGCREGSLSLDFQPPALQACVDYWSAGATGEFTYTANPGGRSNLARIVVSFGMPEALAGPVEPGTEYYAFRLALNNAKSVGVGSCYGCLDPACIVLNEITLYQPAGQGDQLICHPWTVNFVAWNETPGGFGCPPLHQPPCITPTLNRTWGQLKGVYR